MPARKPPPPNEKSQRDRFIETARKIGASEDPEDFERVFRQVVKPAPLKRQGPERSAPRSRDDATGRAT